MRRRLSIVGLLLAWLCASGAMLDIEQVFAWTRMCVNYADTMPLSMAVSRTFDPAKPCEICHAVMQAREAAKESGRAAVPTDALQKIILFVPGVVATVLPPSLEDWPRWGHLFAAARIEPVRLRPPRVA